MPWRDALDLARYALLVGREAECTAFENLLDDDASDVLLITGGAGAGKTTLLRQFEVQARARGYAVHLLDLPLALTAEALEGVLEAATPLRRSNGLLVDPAAPRAPYVLLVDAASEVLGGHAINRLLRALPGTARLVVACPEAPVVQRTDGALRRFVREWRLGPLPDDDARVLLSVHGVAEEAQAALLRFARGQPLALVLAADACMRAGAAAYDPAQDADLVATLAARYLREVGSRENRTALYAASLVRTLDEPLLAALLDVDDAYVPFEALRHLSFVHARAGGLTLDPLARTALVADLRWRNADLHATLHRRVRTTYARRLADPADGEHSGVLSDYLFLLRDNPIVKPFFGLLMHEDGQLVAGDLLGRSSVAQPVHYPEIIAQVRRHEGDAAAGWADHWLRTQPASTRVYLEPDGRVGGLLMALALDAHGPDPAGDPAVVAAAAYLHAQAPLRKGERATLFRFWMAAEAYQNVSPTLGLIFADTVRHYLTTPRLAFSFLPFADADAWGLVMAIAGLTRLTQADFEVDGHPYGVFAQDWRRVPAGDWLDRIARFGLASEPPEAPRGPRALLDREKFAEAVRLALRDYTAPEALLRNALLDARIGAERQGQEAPTETLRRLLLEAAAPLAASPRTAKMYRALEATFFQPAPTQEQAAERLDVPFSTYRRHLRAGQEAVIDTLWARELGGSGNEPIP